MRASLLAKYIDGAKTLGDLGDDDVNGYFEDDDYDVDDGNGDCIVVNDGNGDFFMLTLTMKMSMMLAATWESGR